MAALGKAVTFRVGCSGWSYNHWRNIFYPPGVPQSKWFAHYASLFDTVEINNSFYRIPSEQVFKSWALRAPPGFVYAIKVNRTVTQYHKLDEEAYPRFEDFAARSEQLGRSLGPLLLQLPPSFGRNDDRLDAFLSQPAAGKHRIAMEFRHKSWFEDEVYALLRHHHVALALSDLEGLPLPDVTTTKWVYARFHGSRGKYFGSYTDDELHRWAGRLKALATEGYVYYNNDAQAEAPKDALRMRELLGAS